MIVKERIPLSSLSPENRQKRLDDLYEYGKSKGTLTYKEIMDRLMELEMDSDQLDHVLETLDAYGVTVVNDSSDETVRYHAEQFSSEKLLEDELSLRIDSGRPVFGKNLKIYQYIRSKQL